MKVLTQKNIKITILWSFAYKLVCVDDEFTKQIVVFRGRNAGYEFVKAIKEYQYCAKLMKKHSNKNLIMSEEEENNFNRVTFAGFVRNSLKMTMKKLEIVVT